MFSGVWRILTGVAGFYRPGFLGLRSRSGPRRDGNKTP